jgi:hypothetical protein
VTSKCQLQFYAEVAQPISKLQILWQFRNRLKRFSKRRLNYIQQFWREMSSRRKEGSIGGKELTAEHLQAGDVVRVRSREEIKDLLDRWGELKGCGFMEEMWVYCDTNQVVRKRVERFLDEATFRTYTAKGLVVLEGLMCEGTVDFGRCDRSCFYFWREEWMEKIG